MVRCRRNQAECMPHGPNPNHSGSVSNLTDFLSSVKKKKKILANVRSTNMVKSTMNQHVFNVLSPLASISSFITWALSLCDSMVTCVTEILLHGATYTDAVNTTNSRLHYSNEHLLVFTWCVTHSRSLSRVTVLMIFALKSLKLLCHFQQHTVTLK